MATRTQKKAMKEKAEAEAKQKAPAKAAKSKAAKKTKATAPGVAAKSTSPTSLKRRKSPAKATPAPVQTPAQPDAARDAPGVLIEFQDTTVEPAPSHAEAPTTPVDDAAADHADNVAAELMRRRSKPIVLDAEDEPTPRLPVGGKHRTEEVLQLDPAPPAKRSDPPAPQGLSIPEHFLLLAIEDGWDERREKTGAGGLGGALVGSLLLELVLQGKLQVQRDRFVLTDKPVDAAAQAVVEQLGASKTPTALPTMTALAKRLPDLLPAYKDRLAGRGLIAHEAWRHLGLFYRSQTALLDGDAQERLRNKLARAIAGGGRPDAPTILSLGLLEACGLFGVVVPEGAQAYNRKRLNGLLAGKDVMGYKVDDELRGMQEMAVRTILDNVRAMTVR